MVNSPRASLAALLRAPVSCLVRVTVAAGTCPPLGSATTPRTTPETVCACAAATKTSTAMVNLKRSNAYDNGAATARERFLPHRRLVPGCILRIVSGNPK